jgi:cytochrome c
MSRFPEALGGALLCAALAASPLASADEKKPAGYYGYGQVATPEQIAGWDIDIRPDGAGLPPGSGSVEDGEFLYEAKCAQCHGSFGESVGRYPALAGGEGSLQDARPEKTVGSYWRYTSTLWDYIHRAMPFTQPESLADDEVYAITAYVLYLNDLVDYDFVLDQDNLAEVRLPNEDNFVAEARPDVTAERCMKDCRDPAGIEITSEAEPYEPEPGTPGAGGLVVAAKPTARGLYQQNCALCHAEGLGGAPVVGELEDWTARIGQGIDVLYRHAIEGYQGADGIMPAKGGFAHLTDEEVEQAVDYMVENSQ